MYRLFFIFFVSIFSNAIFAAVPNDDSIDRLFKNVNLESKFEDIAISTERKLQTRIEEMANKEDLTKGQREIVDKAPSAMMSIYRAEFTWKKIRPIYLKLYKDTFSQEEIDDLNTFFESKSGRAFLRKSPIVEAKVAISLEEVDRQINAKYDELFDKLTKEFDAAAKKGNR